MSDELAPRRRKRQAVKLPEPERDDCRGCGARFVLGADRCPRCGLDQTRKPAASEVGWRPMF